MSGEKGSPGATNGCRGEKGSLGVTNSCRGEKWSPCVANGCRGDKGLPWVTNGRRGEKGLPWATNDCCGEKGSPWVTNGCRGEKGSPWVTNGCRGEKGSPGVTNDCPPTSPKGSPPPASETFCSPRKISRDEEGDSGSKSCVPVPSFEGGPATSIWCGCEDTKNALVSGADDVGGAGLELERDLGDNSCRATLPTWALATKGLMSASSGGKSSW